MNTPYSVCGRGTGMGLGWLEKVVWNRVSTSLMVHGCSLVKGVSSGCQVESLLLVTWIMVHDHGVQRNFEFGSFRWNNEP
jgi:hypothetical protein